MRSLLSIDLPNPPSHLIRGAAPPEDQGFPPGIFPFPERQVSVPEEVLVVQAEFFQAGAGHLGEFELHFFGGGAGFAALSDILHAAAGGLHHLVVGTASFSDVSVAKANRHIVAELGDLEAQQLSVAAMLGDEGIVGHGGGQGPPDGTRQIVFTFLHDADEIPAILRP